MRLAPTECQESRLASDGLAAVLAEHAAQSPTAEAGGPLSSEFLGSVSVGDPADSTEESWGWTGPTYE